MNNKKFWIKLSAIISTTVASSKSPAIDLQSKPKNSDKTDFNTISSPFKGKPGKHSLIGEVSNTEYPLVLSNNGKVSPLIKGLQAFELSYLYGITDSLQLGILIPGEKPTGVVGSFDEGKSYLTNILIEPKIYISDNIALIPLYYMPGANNNVQTSINGNKVIVPTTNEKAAYGGKVSIGFGEKNIDDTLIAVQIGAIIAPESKFREIDQSLKYQFGAGVNHKLSGNLKLLIEAYGEKTSSNAPLEALAMIEYSNDSYMLRIGGGSGDLKGSGSNTSRVLANFAYYFGEEATVSPKKYKLDGEVDKERFELIRKRMIENELRDQNIKINEDLDNQEKSPLENQESPSFDTESRVNQIYPGKLVCDNSDFSQVYSRAIASVSDAGAVGEGAIENPIIKELMIASTDKALVRKIKYYSKNINNSVEKLAKNLSKIEKAKAKGNKDLIEQLEVEINWGIRVFYKNKYELDKFIPYTENAEKELLSNFIVESSSIVQKAQQVTGFSPKVQDVNIQQGSQFKVDVKTSLLMRSQPKIDSGNVVGKLLVNDVVEAISQIITNGYVQIKVIESSQKTSMKTPVYVHGNFLKKIENTLAENKKVDLDSKNLDKNIVNEPVPERPEGSQKDITVQIFKNNLLESKNFFEKDKNSTKLEESVETIVGKDLSPSFSTSLENIQAGEDLISLARNQKGESVEVEKSLSQLKEVEAPETVKVEIKEDPKKDLTPSFAASFQNLKLDDDILLDAKSAKGQSVEKPSVIATKKIENNIETEKIAIEEEKPIVLEIERINVSESAIAKQIFKNEINKSKDFLKKDETSENLKEDPVFEKKDLTPAFASNLLEDRKFHEVLEAAKESKGSSSSSSQSLNTLLIPTLLETVKVEIKEEQKKDLTPAFAPAITQHDQKEDLLKLAAEQKGESTKSSLEIQIPKPLAEKLETVKVEIKEEPKKDLTPVFASSLQNIDASSIVILAAKTAKGQSDKESTIPTATKEIIVSLDTVKVDVKDLISENEQSNTKATEVKKTSVITIPEIAGQDSHSVFGDSFVFEKISKKYIQWDENSIAEPEPEINSDYEQKTLHATSENIENSESFVLLRENKEDQRNTANSKITTKLPPKSIDKKALEEKNNEISKHLSSKLLERENNAQTKQVEKESVKQSEIVIEVVNNNSEDSKIIKKEIVETKGSEASVSSEKDLKKEPVIIIENQSPIVKEQKNTTLVIVDEQNSKKETKELPVIEVKSENEKTTSLLPNPEVVEVKSLEDNNPLLNDTDKNLKGDLTIKEAEERKVRIQEEMNSIDDYINKKLNTSPSVMNSDLIEKKSETPARLKESSEDILLKNVKEKEKKENQLRINSPLQEQDGIEEQNGPSFGGLGE